MESAELRRYFTYRKLSGYSFKRIKKNPEMLEFAEGYNDVTIRSLLKDLHLRNGRKKFLYLFNGIKDGDMNLMEQVI